MVSADDDPKIGNSQFINFEDKTRDHLYSDYSPDTRTGMCRPKVGAKKSSLVFCEGSHYLVTPMVSTARKLESEVSLELNPATLHWDITVQSILLSPVSNSCPPNPSKHNAFES